MCSLHKASRDLSFLGSVFSFFSFFSLSFLKKLSFSVSVFFGVYKKKPGLTVTIILGLVLSKHF